MKKLMDERITTEEAEYLKFTRRVNEIKNALNEVEKQKIELHDRLRELIKYTDELDTEYSEALEDMLTASAKVK